MSMSEWARKEIERVCENGCEYDCEIYKSAHKAFQSLLGDGHSGYSMSMVKQILNRLLDGKPLTPIEDVPEVWKEPRHMRNGDIMYQCKRMPSLFKYIYPNGTVRYKDINRVRCQFLNNSKAGELCDFGFPRRIVDDLIPIQMPYYPDEPYIVVCQELHPSTDNNVLDILYAYKDGEELISIFRMFRETDRGYIEITDKNEQEQIRSKEIFTNDSNKC